MEKLCQLAAPFRLGGTGFQSVFWAAAAVIYTFPQPSPNRRQKYVASQDLQRGAGRSSGASTKDL